MTASLSNWAIVIGINCYDDQKSLPCLKGAVPDALEISKWLVKHGNVPPQNLRMILSPCEESEIPPGTNCRTSAKRKEDILDTLRLILLQSQGRGERFYFYYSGHGLNIKDSRLDEQLLLPQDFDPMDVVAGISLRCIQDCMARLEFKEEYFFVDACRFYDDNTELIGALNCKRLLRKTQQPNVLGQESGKRPQQFTFYATSPMSGAIDNRKEATGTFTKALLAGLNGCGNAKRYHSERKEYIVRPRQLGIYIRNEVMEKANSSGQLPECGGVNWTDPELVRLPASSVQSEKLKVFVNPDKTYSSAAVYVTRDQKPVESRNPMTKHPEEFILQPKEYSIFGSAPNYQTDGTITIDAYEPLERTIMFKPLGK